jgi:hypothetical protein
MYHYEMLITGWSVHVPMLGMREYEKEKRRKGEQNDRSG